MPRSVSVVSSKAAQRDMLKIKADHENILNGLANQSQKVDMYKQQQAAVAADQQTKKIEVDNARMTNDTTVKKNDQDFAIKQAELSIKSASLHTNDV